MTDQAAALTRPTGDAPGRPRVLARFLGRGAEEETAPSPWLERAAARHMAPPAMQARKVRLGSRAKARRKAARRRLALAALAFLAISAAGGAALYLADAGGLALPGSDRLASLGESLRSLLPAVPEQSAKGDAEEVRPAAADGEAPAEEKAAPLVGEGKPVQTVRLVTQDAAGQAPGPIPLTLALEEPAGGADLALRLTGLPEDASLTAGARLSDGAWLVAPGETADLKLTLAHPLALPLRLEVAAIEKASGELAAPVQEMAVAVTGNANSEALLTQATVLPVRAGHDEAKAAAADRLAQGLERLLAGDVEAARDLFRQALDLGEKRAIAHLGRTYDPVVHERLKLAGPAPDALQAIAWYLRAKEAGDGSADGDLAALAAWSKR
jgi:hypothetical protein